MAMIFRAPGLVYACCRVDIATRLALCDYHVRMFNWNFGRSFMDTVEMPAVAHKGLAWYQYKPAYV